MIDRDTIGRAIALHWSIQLEMPSAHGWQYISNMLLGMSRLNDYAADSYYQYEEARDDLNMLIMIANSYARQCK